MALVFSRRPYRKYRPQDLNGQHPLAEGLVFFAFPGDDARDLVSGRMPVSNAGYAASIGLYGRDAQFASGAANCQNFGSYFVLPSACTTYTFAALAKPSSVAAVGNFVQIYDDSGTNNNQIVLAANANFNAAATAGIFSLFEYNGGFNTAIQSNASTVDGNWHIFAGSRPGGAVCKLYQDGVDVSSSTASNTASAISSAAGPVCIGGSPSTNRAGNFPIEFVAIWNRTLAPEEHFAFALNPFVIFHPRGMVSPRPWWRILWGLATGGGANFLTLTATAASSATLQRAVGLIRAATQSSAASALRFVGALRTATSASAATLATVKVKLLTLAATSAAVATLARQIGAVRAATSPGVATLRRAISATRSATQSAAASVVRAVGWARATTSASAATVASIKVKLLVLIATQASAATLRRSVGIVRSAGSSALTTLARVIQGGIGIVSAIPAVSVIFRRGPPRIGAATAAAPTHRLGVDAPGGDPPRLGDAVIDRDPPNLGGD